MLSQAEKTSLIPKLKCFLVCRRVTLDSYGLQIYQGIVDYLPFPQISPPLTLVTRWIDGEGAFEQRLSILDPNLNCIYGPKIETVVLRHRAETYTRIAQVLNVDFRLPGVYWFSISISDSDETWDFPFPIYPQAPEPTVQA